VTSRLAAFRKERRHPQLGFAPERVASSRPAASPGDRWRGSAGFLVITVVLVDRIDCRSRRAAHGPSRPRAKSPRTTTRGLAVPRESAGAVKKRRKPDPRRQARGPVAGSDGRSRERSPHRQRGTRRGKALWVVNTAPFDEGAAEAILVSRGSLGFRPREAAGRDRGRQNPSASFESGRERPPRSGRRPRGLLPALPSPRAGA